MLIGILTDIIRCAIGNKRIAGVRISYLPLALIPFGRTIVIWTNRAEEIADQVDVILLAQGSMAYAEEAIHEKIGKPVLSSPRFGAQALAAALKAKGL